MPPAVLKTASGLPASSPCVKLCLMDASSGLCEGCGRSLAEIGNWSRMSEAERLLVMRQLPARLHALRPDTGD